MFAHENRLLLPILLLFGSALSQCENELENGVIDTTVDSTTIPVLCEVYTDGGGWMVILQRKDGSFDFSAPQWNDFAHSTQGSFEGEFFQSLDELYLLTKDKQMELFVRMRDGVDNAWAYYENFQVGPESDKFRLIVSGYDNNSSAGDSLSQHNSMEWSSPDQDNDTDLINNCAGQLQSSWWFKHCYYSNPLGVYGDEATLAGNSWNSWKGLMNPLEEITFKIRQTRCLSGPGLMCNQCKPGYYLCTSSLGLRSCCTNFISSCAEASSRGIFDLVINGNKQPVWCEESYEGGGWMTILRRMDGSVNFSFYDLLAFSLGTVGSLTTEFMLSLDLLNSLTSTVRYELDVTITYNGVYYNSKYGYFMVDDQASGYMLNIAEYSTYSTAGDSLIPKSNGRPWSTYDSDNDSLLTDSCANIHSSAFWFGACTDANPLGNYGDTNTGKGVNWNSLFGDTISLDSIEFKIRPNVCPFGPSRTCNDCGPGKYVCSIPGEGTSCCTQPISSCQETSQPGPYQVLFNGQVALLYCSPHSAAGGWTTILRRFNGAVDFSSAEWNTCAHDGIGQVGTQFLLALDLIHALTKNGDMELLIEMNEDTHYSHAWFGHFSVEDQTSNYRLTVEEFDSGSPAGNAFLLHSGSMFSTFDHDNDSNPTQSCGLLNQAPFWFNDCFSTNPLGQYGDETGKGITYLSFYPITTSLERIEFKIRKKRCAQGVGSTCEECKAGYYLCTTNDGYLDCCQNSISSCEEAKRSGIFDLLVGSEKWKVYCDMTTEGGGWVELLARRTGNINDFYLQSFSTYQFYGYGVVGGDNMLPLEFWNFYTNRQNLELLVEVQYSSTPYWALYQNIRIDGAVDQFTFHLQNYDTASSLSNDLGQANGEKFSAIDRDNDANSNRHCAFLFKRAFWSRNCGYVNPLGEKGNSQPGDGLYWHSLTGCCNSLDTVFFKARVNQCTNGFGSTCTSCSHGYTLVTDTTSGRKTCSPFCDPKVCSRCYPKNPRLCMGKCQDGYYKDQNTSICKSKIFLIQNAARSVPLALLKQVLHVNPALPQPFSCLTHQLALQPVQIATIKLQRGNVYPAPQNAPNVLLPLAYCVLKGIIKIRWVNAYELVQMVSFRIQILELAIPVTQAVNAALVLLRNHALNAVPITTSFISSPAFLTVQVALSST